MIEFALCFWILIQYSMNKTSAYSAILTILAQDLPLDRADVMLLQKNMNAEGFSSNFSLFGADGILGSKSFEDIADFCASYPEALLSLSSDITKEMFSKGHSNRLMSAVNENPSIRAQLLAECNDILGGRHVDQLSADELKDVQSRWKLTGFYSKDIDGITGPGTRAAMEMHQQFYQDAGIAIIKERPATQNGAPILGRDFSHVAFNKDENGFGVSNAAIKAAWDGVKGQPTQPLESTSNSSRPIIVLDLGHGTAESANGLSDQGAVSPHTGMSEVDVVDPVGDALAKELRAAGYDVAFTRKPGETTQFTYSTKLGGYNSREARGEFAAKLEEITGQEAIFISLHANSFKDPSVGGSETYAGSVSRKNGRMDFGLAALNQDSMSLAHTIADNFSLAPNGTTRTKTAEFGALRTFDGGRSSGTAGTLIELGYLSNAQDSQALKNMAESPGSAAKQIANGIIAFDRQRNPTYRLAAKAHQRHLVPNS